MASLRRTFIQIYKNPVSFSVVNRSYSNLRKPRSINSLYTTCGLVAGAGLVYFVATKWRKANTVYALKARKVRREHQ